MIGTRDVSLALSSVEAVNSRSISICKVRNYSAVLTTECHQDHQGHIEGLQANVDVKVCVVLDTHAVVDPLAVVVESLHAHIANVAVARVSRADYLARWTQHVGIELFNQLQELD